MVLSENVRHSFLKLARRSQAARQAGDTLAQYVLDNASRYPDLVPMARAVLDPVVDRDQEAA